MRAPDRVADGRALLLHQEYHACGCPAICGKLALTFVMLREERHGDVIRLEFATRWSRAMGLTVSTYAVRGALVDTAFHDVRAELGAWIDARRPDGAIVTHYHEDHAGNVE